MKGRQLLADRVCFFFLPIHTLILIANCPCSCLLLSLTRTPPSLVDRQILFFVLLFTCAVPSIVCFSLVLYHSEILLFPFGIVRLGTPIGLLLQINRLKMKKIGEAKLLFGMITRESDKTITGGLRVFMSAGKGKENGEL